MFLLSVDHLSLIPKIKVIDICHCLHFSGLHSELHSDFTHLHTVMCMLSCSVMPNSVQPHGLQPARLLCLWDSPDKNTGVDFHSIFQGIFLNPGMEPTSPAFVGRFFTRVTWEALGFDRKKIIHLINLFYNTQNFLFHPL